MNKVILIGRLSKDIELRYTITNKAVASTSIAVNRIGTEEADFINLVAWGKQAENLHKYCSKGRLIAVEGRIQTRNYEDQNGNKKYVTEVVADNIQFLESKSSSERTQENTEKTDSEIIRDVVNDKDPFSEFAEELQYEEQMKMNLDPNDLPF